MATRLYLSRTEAAPVTPAANGSWGYTSEAGNYALKRTPSGTSLAGGAFIGAWTAGQTALDRYYVSEPLNAQTIAAGTVKAQLQAREFASSDNVTTRFEAYVVSNDGSVVRGTLIAIGALAGAELLQTGFRNVPFADGDATSEVVASLDDRIVVAFGYGDASGTTPEGQAVYGDPVAGGDLPEDSTDTSSSRPWVEFSADITFNVPIVGTLTATIAAVTLSSAGTLPIVGALTASIGEFTLSAVGALPIVGTLTKTLDAVTVSSAGTLPIVGTSTPTLDAVTLSSAGALPIVGTATPTLDAVTLTTVATLPIVGTLSTTLDAITVASVGALPIVGTLAATLDAVTLSSVGALPIVGSTTLTSTVRGNASLTSRVAGAAGLLSTVPEPAAISSAVPGATTTIG